MRKSMAIVTPLCFLLASCADLTTAKNAYQKGDYATARANWVELAKRGFPEAQTKLAEMNMAGIGMKPNPQEGVRLLKEALRENDPGAMVALGKAYLKG